MCIRDRDNYRLRGNQLEIVNDQGSVVKSLTLSGTFGTVTPLWGNDQFVIVKIESPWSVLDEYFKIPCNGGSGVEVSNPGDKMYVYRGILYTINGKYLYRWDGQGNVTKLCESNHTLSSYSFLQGYFFYRSAYDIVSVKL